MKELREGWKQTVVLVGPAIVALAFVVWGGVRVWQSASVGADTQPDLAIVLGANLFLCLWVWYRARPGSGFVSAMAPVIALLMAAMLLGKLPRVFWPAAEGIHLAGSIAGNIVITGLIVVQIRRILVEIRRPRSLNRGARPV